MSKLRSKSNSIKPDQYLRRELEKANQFLSKKKPQQALYKLMQLNEKFPQNLKVLELLAYAYSDLKNQLGFLFTMIQLNDLDNSHEYNKIGLAEAYLVSDFRALALQTYRQIYQRWPDSEQAQNVQEFIRKLEQELSESSRKLNLPLEAGLDFFSKHEQIQILMHQEEFEKGKKLANELLQQQPKFAPVWNNLSHIAWLEGNLSDAIEILQKVLDFQPENVHALSTLAKYLFMQGKKKEALSLSAKLQTAKTMGHDFWLKKVGALGFIGNDDGVIHVLDRAKADPSIEFIEGEYWHWCAVAEYRKGNVTLAQTYWKKCTEVAPYFNLARDNLEELNKPIYDRICPQVFNFESWLPKKIIEEITAIVDDSSQERKTKDEQDKLFTFYLNHPQLFPFIKTALVAGDLVTRELSLQLAGAIAAPEMMNWLKSFALGEIGPDSLRLKAAQILTQHDIFKSGQKINLWVKGERKPVVILGFKIEFKNSDDKALKPSTRIFMERAIDALRDMNGRKAEILLRDALKIQPQEPNLINNLAFSLQMQGKKNEANAMASQMVKEFPDYFFSRLILIRSAMYAGNFDKAQSYLDSLMKKDTLHISEFSALCSCQIDFHMLKKDAEGVKNWHQVWKDVYPDDPTLDKYRNLRIPTNDV